jgi:hypothetical protein
VKLDEDIKKAEEDFKKAEGFTYNGRDLAHREKDLINRLNSYIERKDTELKAQPEGKKNETSLSRMNAAKASLELLEARLKKEINSPTITAEGREDALLLSEYVTLSNDENYRITEREDKVEDSGMDILKTTIEEYDYQRIKSATILGGKDGMTDSNLHHYKGIFDESIKGALYCEMLKTAFSPRVNDNPKTLAEKDLKLKMMLRKSVEESKTYGMLDSVMKTKFGVKLKDSLFDSVIKDKLKPVDLKGVLEHDSIIYQRDSVLKECFKEEMAEYTKFLGVADKGLDKMYNEGRRNDINFTLKELEKYETRIDSLISLSEQLSSKALSDDAKQYEKIKTARIERNNKREEVRAAKKQAAIEKRNKASGGKNNSADNKGKNKEEVKNTGMHV